MQEILPTAVRFPLAMLVGGIVAAAFGVLVGVPVLRFRGDYLAIVTLAFGEIIRSIIINLNFTGGAAGLKGTPQRRDLPGGLRRRDDHARRHLEPREFQTGARHHVPSGQHTSRRNPAASM